MTFTAQNAVQEYCECATEREECRRKGEEAATIAAMNVYKKITQKHKVVNVTTKVTSVVAAGAPLVGVAIDILSGFTTLGSGTAIRGIVGLSATGCGAAANAAHLAVSCTQHKRISCCFNAVCAPRSAE